MLKFTVFLLLQLSALLTLGECIVCTPEICAATSCVAVENCNGTNQVIKPGRFCDCCPVCYTILGENDPCILLTAYIRGAPPPTTICGKGLICQKGFCRRTKEVIESHEDLTK